MPAGLLLPEDVGPVDASRVVTFLNTVPDSATLAATIGFSEGPQVGDLVARAILAQRATAPFATLRDVLAVTGVTPARFTEIVMALSGARPQRSAAAWTARIQATPPRPLLGQRISLVGQVLNAVGQGVAGVEVTCVTTWGILTAATGLTEQRGTSATVVTEPGGLIRLQLDPPIVPALSALARTALQAELSSLGAAADAAAMAGALSAFADHYRTAAATDLREAVDRLATTFPTDAQIVGAGWMNIPATVIIFTGAEAATVLGLATIPVRNWLPAFLAALRDHIAEDRRIDTALLEIPLQQADSAVLARRIFGVQEALAGLEPGVLGQTFGQAVASAGVGRFLDKAAADLDAGALVSATRAAGTSATAIMSGGFATFDAINAVRQVDDTISGRLGVLTGLDGRLGLLDQRVTTVEATKADISVVDALKADLTRETAVLDGRLSTVEATQVTKADLAAVDARVSQMETNQVTRADLQALTTRISQIEATQITKADLGAVSTRLTQVETTLVTKNDLAALTTRVGKLETGQINRADLTALETKLTQQIATDINTATAGLRTELGTRINAKADATSVVGLQQTVAGLQAETSRLSTKVATVDNRVTVLGAARLIMPGS